MNNYNPLAISGNYKKKQLTLLSQLKLTLTARNTLCVIKSLKHLKKLPRPLFRPKTNHSCHQKPNPSRDAILLRDKGERTIQAFSVYQHFLSHPFQLMNLREM
jgi:hypothetical protein